MQGIQGLCYHIFMSKKDKQNTNMQLLIEYQERVLTPYSWIKQGDELIQASKKLEPSIKKHWLAVSKYFDPNKGTYNPPLEFRPKRLLQATYFMLVAYAIENYFKAILVAVSKFEYRKEIMETGKLPKALNKHDLIKLAGETGFIFNDIELNLLTRLYRNSFWQARYPVPNNANGLKKISSHNGKVFFAAFLAPQDIHNLTIVVRRIKKFSSVKISASQQ